MPKKNYFVIFSSKKQSDDSHIYSTSIFPEGGNKGSLVRQRQFASESEMVAIVNPLLPPGGDMKNVLSLIHGDEGYQKVLALTDYEAALLGWQ